MKTKVCILVLFSAILVAIFSFSSSAVFTNVIDDTGVFPFDSTMEARLESISKKHKNVLVSPLPVHEVSSPSEGLPPSQ